MISTDKDKVNSNKPNKPLGRKNYGSIPHLSNSKLGIGDHFIEKGQERILTAKTRDKHDLVYVFEKYDGSNVGVAKKDGKIHALTRSGYDAWTSPYRQHKMFADWVWEFEENFDEILSEGERICGEWLAQAHGLIYEITAPPIVFFDWFDSNNQRKIVDEIQETGLPIPRMLHKGGALLVEDVMPYLNLKTQYIKSKEKPEGMVYRVERKGKVDFLAKWVRSDFEAGKYCIGVDEKDLIWNI